MEKFFHRAVLASFDRSASARCQKSRSARDIPNEGRRLFFEKLEDRRLLSVTASEYASIREAYVDFGLSEQMSDVNIIEIAANNLTAAALKAAVAEAQATTQDDLIVLRTTDGADTITYAEASDQVQIDLDSIRCGALSIVAWGGNNALTVDANSMSRVFRVNSGTVNLGNLVITGGNGWSYGGGVYCGGGMLTLTNCEVSGNTASQGGGLYCRSGTLTLINCEVSGNSADSSGGGICGAASESMLTLTNCKVSGNGALVGGVWLGGGVYSTGILKLTNSEVSGNGAKFGGGVYSSGSGMLTNCEISSNSSLYGGGVYSLVGTLTLTNCEVSGNNVSDDGGGGGVYWGGGVLTLTNCEVSGNSAGFGGGVYGDTGVGMLTLTNCEVSGNSASYGGGLYGRGNTMTLSNCEVSGNRATVCGGGLFDDGGVYGDGGTLTLTNCEVSGNNASDGGGVYNNVGTLTLTNCRVLGNRASHGGGVYGNGGTLTLTNCEVSGNNAGVGGGAYKVYYGTLTLINSTVSGNHADFNGGIYFDMNATASFNILITLTNSIVTLNYGGNVDADSLSKESSHNLIDADAGFVVAPVFENGVLVNADELDFRLSADSQAIDVGDNTKAYGAGLNEASTDLSGTRRFVDSAIDIGAYEYKQIRNYQIQDGCALCVFEEMESVSEAATYYWKISGTGEVFPAEYNEGKQAFWLNASDLNIAPGKTTSIRLIAIRNGEESLVTESYVTYVSESPVLTADAKSMTGGRLLVLDLAALYSSQRTAAVWTVNWGDGSREVINQQSNSIRTAHYYESTTGGPFTITVSIVDSMGGVVGEQTVLLVDKVPARSAPAEEAVPAVLDDSSAVGGVMTEEAVSVSSSRDPLPYIVPDLVIRAAKTLLDDSVDFEAAAPRRPAPDNSDPEPMEDDLWGGGQTFLDGSDDLDEVLSDLAENQYSPRESGGESAEGIDPDEALDLVL